MTATQSILLGLALLTVAVTMRRTALSRRGQVSRPPARTAAAEMSNEHAGLSAVRELELRLYEYGREIEARLQTRIAVLERLICDADREAGRLQAALKEVGGRRAAVARVEVAAPTGIAPGRSYSPVELRMIRHLLEAGFSHSEIAHLLGCAAADLNTAAGFMDRTADAA